MLKFLRHALIMLHNILTKFEEIWKGQTKKFKNFSFQML